MGCTDKGFIIVACRGHGVQYTEDGAGLDGVMQETLRHMKWWDVVQQRAVFRYGGRPFSVDVDHHWWGMLPEW